MSVPYIDEVHPDHTIRVFDSSLDPEEFYWHRDMKDRQITAVSGEGWAIQHDNELPVLLEKDKNYSIKKESWHRILKGDGDLILKIKEL